MALLVHQSVKDVQVTMFETSFYVLRGDYRCCSGQQPVTTLQYQTMTYDKAEYTITFPNPEQYSAEKYTFAPYEAATSHVFLHDVNTESNDTLTVVVSGDGYVLPLFEEYMREYMPNNVNIECNVTIGAETPNQNENK